MSTITRQEELIRRKIGRRVARILKVVDFVGEEKGEERNKGGEQLKDDSNVEIRGGTENKEEGFVRTEVQGKATKGIVQNCIDLMLIEPSEKDLERDNELSNLGREEKNQ